MNAERADAERRWPDLDAAKKFAQDFREYKHSDTQGAADWIVDLAAELRAAWARLDSLEETFRECNEHRTQLIQEKLEHWPEYKRGQDDGRRRGLAAARAAVDPMIAETRMELERAQTRALRDALKSDVMTLESAQEKIDALLAAGKREDVAAKLLEPQETGYRRGLAAARAAIDAWEDGVYIVADPARTAALRLIDALAAGAGGGKHGS